MEKVDFLNSTHEQRMVSILGNMIDLDCHIHGEYSGYEKDRSCPACDKEIGEAKRINKARDKRLSILAARWSKCGMPDKFCGISLGDWIERTAKHSEVMQSAVRFVDGDTTRMLLIGNCGTGKTMLAAGVIGQMSLKAEPVYITATRLIRSIRDSWKCKDMTEQEVMDKYINSDVLVVDELGAGRCSEDDKLILSEILCDRYSADAPTLLISNMNANQLKELVLDDRAVDRMREGEVVAMNWKSERGVNP